MTQVYRGRFAPSPTGPLHFGSLVAAVASWLDARANHGEWLVRIEDLDPPRVFPDSARMILDTLEYHGLIWDGEVEYQSNHYAYYSDALEELASLGRTYRCSCSRADLVAMGGSYDGRCKKSPAPESEEHAIRFSVEESANWQDLIQGPADFDSAAIHGDFIVFRRDQLFSYQLAVAIDDWQQGITHVIRGFDLFDSTARQIMLLQALNKPAPVYGHFAIAADDQGVKLSKQSHAEAIDCGTASVNIIAALEFLGQEVPPSAPELSASEILDMASRNWRLDKVPKKQSIRVC
jgi:glutamyl-Q tRNA(Asp) synthetase